MSVTIDLPADIEAKLTEQAAKAGVPLGQHLRRMIEQYVDVPLPSPKTPAERARHWRESVANLPDTTPLSDEAMSRESMYGDRG
jgi:hypothetical protein